MTSSTTPSSPESTPETVELAGAESGPGPEVTATAPDSVTDGTGPADAPDTAPMPPETKTETEVETETEAETQTEIAAAQTETSPTPTPETQPAPRLSEKEKLQRAIPGTSPRDLPTLQALHRRLTVLLEADAGAADEELQALDATLKEKTDQHHDWQKSMIDEVEKSLQTLAEHLNEGRVREAQSLWDRNQNTLKRISEEQTQTRLQDTLNPMKAELNKLLDWKKFASSEKKRELIEKMQGLTADETAPGPKSKVIRALQDEWKLLGHSDDNDELWNQFSELAKVAFEPCKIYFKERKEKQAANLIARNNICEQLEAYVATMGEDINLAEISKLEHQTREDWKKFAPVAQNKIKNLQKRFNAVLSELKQRKRNALQTHNAEKLALIEQAKALIETEDLQAAIQQAKKLQQQWKDLGPGSFKEDRKLWADFRSACDALFARRDSISQEQRQQAQQVASAARDSLKKISALLALDDEAFADSRSEFNALSKSFRDALTPDLKTERKPLQDQFTKVSRRYEARLKATPDKKVLQLMQLTSSKAALCQSVEEQLLADGASDTDISALRNSWNELDPVSDANLEELLKKRFRQLEKLLDSEPAERNSNTRTLAEKQSQAARILCVDAEIMCGADTPAADKAIRMQQQLNQLQKGLGRLPPTQKERLDKLHEIELQLICSGPLTALDRNSFMERLQRVRQKA